MTEPDQKGKRAPDFVKAQELLDELHKINAKPSQWMWSRALGWALLPLALLIAVVAITPDPPTPAPAEVNPGQGLVEARLEARERLGDPVVADTVEPSETYLDDLSADDLSAEIAALSALNDASIARTQGTGIVVNQHAVYRAQLFFTASLIALLVACSASLLAQRSLIQTHASGFWPRIAGRAAASTHALFRKEPPTKPLVWIVVWGILGAAIAICVGRSIDAALPWLDGLSGETFSQPGPEGRRLKIMAPLVIVAFSGVFALITVTAYGIALAWRNYPSTAAIRTIGRGLKNELKDHALATKDKAAEPSGGAATDAKITDKTPLADFAQMAWKSGGSKTGPTVASWTLTPKQIVDVIDGLGRALMLVLVLSLVTISLGLDVVEAQLARPETVIDAVEATHDTWLIAVGFAFSLLFAGIYGSAIQGLNPYVEAEVSLSQTAAAKPKGWTITFASDSKVTTVKPIEGPPSPEDFDPEMERYLGASRQKFAILMNARFYAGGYHLLLENGMAANVKTLAGLLAPTVAGGLLAVLG